MFKRYIKTGVIDIILSIIIAYSIIFYDKNVSAPFVASTILPNGTIHELTAYCANIIIQFFGLFSYPLALILFIRGVSYFYWNTSKVRLQRLWLLIFILLAPVLYNVVSTYPVFQNVLSSHKFDCYAGGYVGYALSKIIFIDLFHQTQVYKWQLLIILIVLIWLIQYILCLSYVNIFKTLRKINLMKIRKTAIRTVRNNKNLAVLIKLKSKIFWYKLLKFLNIKKARIAIESPEALELRYKALSLNKQADANEFTTTYQENFADTNKTTIEHKVPIRRKAPSFIAQHRNHDYDVKQYDDLSYEQYGNSHSPRYHRQYVLPTVDLLDKSPNQTVNSGDESFKEMSEELIQALNEFSITGEIVKVKPGPVITLFEFKPSPGIKTSRIISLSEDIARSMSAFSARISTIPGRNAIGIELPNKERQIVYLSELLAINEFVEKHMGIQLVLGKDIAGNPVFADLVKMPHLLIAGTTGSGKSVSINGMILSILFKFQPSECKLIMIDPKMLELSVYSDIPHLLMPVVTEASKAVSALQWAVSEMEQRYRDMARFGVRNIDGFNSKLKNAKENPDLLIRKIQVGFAPDTGQPVFETQKLNFSPMPYIVIVVDEMADLMAVAGKDVETAIQRLAQMARAAGIHLIMATQRPSVDVITGTIKANFPTRISFQVTSKIDSRTILSEQGAEQLLGQGDMLYMSGAGRLQRIHGSFVNDDEIERVVNFIKAQELPHYVEMPKSNGSNDNFQHTIV